MKLLFDQNISFRVIKEIEDIFPNSIQVKLAGLENSTDTEIWTYAKINDFTIVTFDADFADLTSLKSAPPKVIWIKAFDQRTSTIVSLLKEKEAEIIEFVDNSKFSILIVKE